MGTDAHWDQLRTFESVARLGSLTAAAKALGISQSTASRHLAQLEAVAGAPLVLRELPMRLTQKGEAVLAAMAPMVDAALAAHTALEAQHEPRGEVTLATVGEVARQVLAPHVASLLRAHPHLRLRVLADNRVASLAAGDADLAVRFTRPTRGDLVVRRLSTVRYAYFAHRALPRSASTPWLGLCGSLAGIAEQRHAEAAFAPRAARMLVEDVESLAIAAHAGLGVAVLPRGLASRFEALVEVDPAEVGAATAGPVPDRDVWLVVHRSKQRVAKVRAVIAWVERAFAAHTP